MKRFATLSLIFVGLFFLASVGCSDDKPAVIEQPETYEPSEIEQEMQTEEYEKAMNEMGSQ